MNPWLEEEERQLYRLDICQDILKYARNELYLHMRFLDVALSSLTFVPDQEIQVVGTEGKRLLFAPEALIARYQQGRIWVNRAYLHMILHSLFAHIWHRGEREETIWHLACDIAVESVLDTWYKPCLHRPPSPYRRSVYAKLRSKRKVFTAEGLYQILVEEKLDVREKLRLKQEFQVDDHRLWEREQDPRIRQEQQNHWKDIREHMETELEIFSKEASENSKGLLEQVRAENRRRYDYREFLRKFSVLKEELTVDMDSFDYIFYHYGIELYGNMPLIEPLETKELRKIEDFVIVIDTSMSCKGDLVEKFLQETYGILSLEESFFRRLQIHILQCDERVQSHVKIESQEQLKHYMEHLEIRGLGGTDFRPAFQYVEELRQQRAFTSLRGLIYFTDGYGRFPARRPLYDVAFVFFRQDYQDVDVPPWAIKLILDEQGKE
ncbi:MAG: metallopeptidase [Lachnospiraceae bacterium]|nr:metallopeptidase [Lachnospiraceae bacterium]